MLLRVERWRPRPGKGATFEGLLWAEAVPHLRTSPGCVAGGIGRAGEDLLVLSLWSGRDALDAAVADPRWARIATRARALGLAQPLGEPEHVLLTALGFAGAAPGLAAFA
ncbi:MAG TPA: antibiotic biosynthesis monooxygenase [Candidatus Thermoplasmatota archaeon]|nr:antibiotic biosynthesis monooxygenase [Candidatus Thermoplasmatota archaeon]